MNNGSILSKGKIDKLVGFIINKFADEQLSVDEAKVILNNTEHIIVEYSQVINYKYHSKEMIPRWRRSEIYVEKFKWINT